MSGPPDPSRRTGHPAQQTFTTQTSHYPPSHQQSASHQAGFPNQNPFNGQGRQVPQVPLPGVAEALQQQDPWMSQVERQAAASGPPPLSRPNGSSLAYWHYANANPPHMPTPAQPTPMSEQELQAFEHQMQLLKEQNQRVLERKARERQMGSQAVPGAAASSRVGRGEGTQEDPMTLDDSLSHHRLASNERRHRALFIDQSRRI
ncbi:hypothetical protein T439DRAFT_353179 [Meredithblackwellia eburnea MCA 4105]